MLTQPMKQGMCMRSWMRLWFAETFSGCDLRPVTKPAATRAHTPAEVTCQREIRGFLFKLGGRSLFVIKRLTDQMGLGEVCVTILHWCSGDPSKKDLLSFAVFKLATLSFPSSLLKDVRQMVTYATRASFVLLNIDPTVTR